MFLAIEVCAMHDVKPPYVGYDPVVCIDVTERLATGNQIVSCS